MTYYTESLKPRSEKLTLVTCEAVQKIKIFTLNGTVYERVMDNFVVSVKDSSIALTQSLTLPVTLNKWHFDPKTKKLTINVGANPNTKNISVTFRLFFSNAPINLPYDLASGETVEWEALVSSIGQIGQQLDEQSTGIVLESSSNVSLINTDGRFDSIYDTLIWENQIIKFYSWFPSIPLSEKVQLFEGVIESKTFNEKSISFKVKDFVFKLKNQVNLGFYTSVDGNILPAILNTPKRRIYGQVDNLKCVSLDAILGGYLINGTLTGSTTNTVLTGSGTSFLDQLSPNDDIFVIIDNNDYRLGVQSVDSDTQITLSQPLEVSFGTSTIKVKPEIPWRKKNRNWHVAGHKLRGAFTEILLVLAPNTFFVNSVEDFQAGDEITINGFQSNVRRVSGSKIITTTNIIPTPIGSDTIYKRPIKAVYHETKLTEFARDYTATNATEAIVTFEEEAEFNIADQKKSGYSFTFTNGSRTLATGSAVDLTTILNSRDWIRSTSASRSTWYEVLAVNQTTITLRTPISISGGPFTEEAYYKNITPIHEASLVTVNCLGMEVDSKWIRTASDAVRHLILNDALFSSVNETSFAKAKSDCGFTLSMAIPSELGRSAPLVRDVITNINSSVLGSLYGDSTQSISYSILNSTKPSVANILRDDDIISWSVDSHQLIVNQVIVNYRPFLDIYSKLNTNKRFIFKSSFVDDLIGIKNTLEKTLYIYNDADAIVMAQRLALFNSLSSSSVRIKGKLNLAQVLVNDKIFLSLDRLYSRYAGQDRRKIGTVTGVRRDGFGTEITVTDLGNIYNRVPSIAPNTTSVYANSPDDDKIRWGYVLDNNVLTPNPASEVGLGSGIIG